jgi:hypothetical protein
MDELMDSPIAIEETPHWFRRSLHFCHIDEDGGGRLDSELSGISPSFAYYLGAEHGLVRQELWFRGQSFRAVVHPRNADRLVQLCREIGRFAGVEHMHESNVELVVINVSEAQWHERGYPVPTDGGIRTLAVETKITSDPPVERPSSLTPI